MVEVEVSKNFAPSSESIAPNITKYLAGGLMEQEKVT
jgi:hypothetical protein